jgi:mannosyl-oligosaccharide alpha-1,2-mannosidase
MWRMTGDEYWRDVGWTMFESIIKHTRSPFGHAALASTMEVRPRDTYEKGLMVRKVLAAQQDDMESFWFAETLKYFYLLFSDPGLISLDEWVFNTEAHPFRLTKGIRGFG